MISPAPQPLRRSALTDGSPAAPVRIVHLGLGAFHRAHQAWYTAHSDDAAAWGIAAFTGRSPEAAAMLSAQDGLFTLIERADDGDHAEIIGSISRAHDGSDLCRWGELLASERTAVVTLTVTEPGYRLGIDGDIDLSDPAVAADLRTVSDIVSGRRNLDTATVVTTAPGRLLLGLHLRRAAAAGPLAVVPCDNIPGNGPMLRRAILTLAEAVDAELVTWLGEQVSFVSTSVDRITPRTTAEDRVIAARLTGFEDAAPVVTEPFSDWVLSGEFPAGRPAWETAGARFVADIAPFERRKLWLLNGSHSLLAYMGLARGHTTVAEAIADPVCRTAVDALWVEAARGLPESLRTADYCTALVRRFSNSRIAHRLAQIGMEGTAKLSVRIAPIALAERAAGRSASGCAAAFAAWTRVALDGTLPPDAQAVAVSQAASTTRPVPALLALVSPDLAADSDFVTLVETAVTDSGVGAAT